MSVNIKENGQLVKTAGLNSQTVIIDNLTTQDSTKALSANQGYVLNQNKVDKVTGKGLSTNDYTNEDKAKVTSSDSKITNYEDRGYLGKNLLKVTAKNTTINGLTFTVNDDGSIKISGTATANTYFYPFGSGVPSNVVGNNVIVNGSTTGVAIRIWHYDGTNTVQSENGNDSPTVTISTAECNIDVRVASGTTVNTTIYPMLRLATGSTTYVPYAKSNIELDATKIDKTASEIQTSDGQFTTVTGGLMQSCVVDLDPIQDLHGYSKPWTGGSGKNKLPLTVANVKLASTTGTWSGNKYTINGVTYELFANEDDAITSIKATGTATADAPIVLYRNLSLPNGNYMWSASPSGGSGSTYRAYLTGVTASDTGNGATFSISGQTIGVACIISNGYAIPSSGVIFKPQIESGSTKTTFEPYTNICAISGHTSVSVGNCGKNKFPYPYLFSSTTRTGMTITAQSDGKIVVTGTSTSSVVERIDVQYVTLDVGSYIISGLFPKTGCYATLRDGDTGAWIANIETNSYALNVASKKKYLIAINITSGNTTGVTYEPMIRKASDSADFEPYNGYTTTINLGGTYYGGTLDAVSGKLTVTHGFKTFDGSENGWALYEFSTGLYRAYISVADMKPLSSDTQVANLVCNQYPTDSYSSPSTSGERITGRASSGQINVFETTQSTLANWKTYLGTNNLQIAYELATPQTIQLTPTQLETLVGQNNVFAPLVGQTLESVEYREVLAIDDVPKAIPYENVAPDMGTGEDRTYFRIKKYGRLVQLEFIQSNYWMVVEQQTKVVFGVLPDGYYDKQPSSMLHPDVEFEYPFVNETATNQYDNKKLFINMVNGEVYSVYQANDEIHPMGSITYILDHD